jgi:DNA-binding CsgD family transcriptional regulator/tetratricopeptide (TPR) repeat protein
VVGGLTREGCGWWAGYVTGSAVFVGRERELSRLRAVLGGDARLLLVVGDAGVGKTRLVTEGLRLAAADGLVTVSGGCLPLAEKLPLLPVADALGELGRLDEGKVLEATLAMTAPYVRVEVGRLLPRLGSVEDAPGGRGEGWRRERLFAALAELLEAVARRAGFGLVIEDVHWADSATLDFLTFLVRASRGGAVTVVVTCRSDEAPLEPQVAGWLAHMRGGVAVEEIRLCPLSAEETAEQVAALMGGRPPAPLVRDLYVRGEGNPFFTEQLVAAALAEHPAGGLRTAAELPARLGELLAARAGGCGEDAGAVLAALAVAGRPLADDLLGGITGLAPAAIRLGLRELSAARLLADRTVGGAHRLRHALLAEAVAAGLLPGEQKVLHERAAQTLEAVGDEGLAGEVARHWAAAGRPAEELPARLAAARAAERVFGYAEAAGHWRRAIKLCDMLGSPSAAGIDLARLYVRAIDTSVPAGDGERASELAEEAYRRFAGHPDSAVAAVVHERAAVIRQRAAVGVGLGPLDTSAAGLPLMEKALALFEQAPPSADQAGAWLDYAALFLFHGEGRLGDSAAATTRALQLAEAVGATALIPRALSFLADDAFLGGRIQEAFALVDRGRAVAESSGNAEGTVVLAVNESDNLIELAQFERAIEVALGGLRAARQAGLDTVMGGTWLAVNAAKALLARGRTAEAVAMIDPLTTSTPDRYRWPVHVLRAQLDLLRGDIGAASGRQQQVTAIVGHIGSVDFARVGAQCAAELALWAGRPGDALEEVRRVLALFKVPDMAILCGQLMATGMRACADLAEGGRARRDEPAAAAARAAAAELASWADRMGGAPFTDHALVAAIPAERATWDAERTRLDGVSDPAAWQAAANAWQELGCPHRVGYACWRHAEAQLRAGRTPAAVTALQAAAAAADGHAPLLADIRKLAERARIPLQLPSAPSNPPRPVVPRHGLTARELAVLRLLAAGQTNAQIGARLYMSPKTASVHVTSIFRKLGVASRVQAAAVAERAGLLEDEQP